MSPGSLLELNGSLLELNGSLLAITDIKGRPELDTRELSAVMALTSRNGTN